MGLATALLPFREPNRYVQLGLLTIAYVLGEMTHWLPGVVSRDMARELEYGDLACYESDGFNEDSIIDCGDFDGQSECEDTDGQCYWDYSGLGIEYQILAGSAFANVFACFLIINGMMADVLPRTAIVGTAIIVFSIATALMGAATEYWHLVVCRMGIAAGLAAMNPVCTSYITDLWPGNGRSAALGVFYWGIYFGYSLTFLVGTYGTEADVFGLGWRFAYIVIGIPAILVGVIILIMRDRSYELRRKAKNEDNEVKPVHWARSMSVDQLKEIGRAFIQPALLLVIFSAVVRQIAGLAWGGNSALFYLTYYEDFDAATFLSWVPVVGGASGVFFGGVASDWIKQRLGLRARLWLLGAMLLISSPFAFMVLYFPPPESCYILLVYYLFAETWFSILFTIIVELVPAAVKTSMIGMTLFFMNIIGGNITLVIDPLEKAIGYKEALFLFWPVLAATGGIGFLLASIPAKSLIAEDQSKEAPTK